MSVFYELENVPVNSSVLLPTREIALAYPKGHVWLAHCRSCGFIANIVFDPGVVDYSTSCEESQSFSPHFKAFARDLAGRLIQQYELRDRVVLEIGCGKGDFISLLCELGQNRGIGIDPSYVRGRLNSKASSRITFITDFYSEKYSDLDVDFVCCRHTLEHIQDTHEFVSMVRGSIGDRRDTIVFFEVPDVARILRDVAFWDIYYEHCSYFSLGSLGRLFRSCGFDVLDLCKAFDDQYLLITARPAYGSASAPLPEEDDLEQVAGAVEHFRANYPSTVEEWRTNMQEIRAKGQRAVLWGSGSKAVGYLTTLTIGKEIEFVVDINPYKQGMYVAGTGQKIVPPAFLRQYHPDVVIVMNQIYREEIKNELDNMAVDADIVAL